MTVKIKNVSPFGDLEVPLLGQVVKQGSIIEVSEEHAEKLLLMEDNFKPWGPDARDTLEHAEEAQPNDPKKAGDPE